MISTLRNNLTVKNLDSLTLKVTKILRIWLKRFCEFEPFKMPYKNHYGVREQKKRLGTTDLYHFSPYLTPLFERRYWVFRPSFYLLEKETIFYPCHVYVWWEQGNLKRSNTAKSKLCTEVFWSKITNLDFVNTKALLLNYKQGVWLFFKRVAIKTFLQT
jgi:hypothetical protein